MMMHAEIADPDYVECRGTEDLAGLAADRLQRAADGRTRTDHLAGGRRRGHGRDRWHP